MSGQHTTELKGLDIHGGLRVWLEYTKEFRAIHAKYSTEPGVVAATVRTEVEDYIARLRQTLGYAEAWLTQFRCEQGEVMERAEETR